MTYCHKKKSSNSRNHIVRQLEPSREVFFFMTTVKRNFGINREIIMDLHQEFFFSAGCLFSSSWLSPTSELVRVVDQMAFSPGTELYPNILSREKR